MNLIEGLTKLSNTPVTTVTDGITKSINWNVDKLHTMIFVEKNINQSQFKVLADSIIEGVAQLRELANGQHEAITDLLADNGPAGAETIRT